MQTFAFATYTFSIRLGTTNRLFSYLCTTKIHLSDCLAYEKTFLLTDLTRGLALGDGSGMAQRLQGRDAAELLLELVRGYSMDKAREAGRRPGLQLRPDMDTPERQLRRHFHGIRRPVVVQRLQQLLRQ